MYHFLSYAILAIGLLIGAWFLSFSIRLITSDKIEGNKSAARTPSLTYNKRKKRIEISGRLSEDRIFDLEF